MSMIDSQIRIFTAGLITAGFLAACGPSDTTSSSSNSTSSTETVSETVPGSEFEFVGDHAVGNPDAPVTIVEYASVVCGACANWHNSVYPDLKKKYIESGKVRFIFREFPTSPERLAFAGFTIANCAGEDKFLQNISVQFKRQSALLRAQDKRGAYENLAKASGLSVEEYETCLNDPDWKNKYDSKVQSAIDAGVTSTPSFFINGTKTKVFTMEQFDEILGPMLGETPAEEPIQEAAE